MLFRLAVPNITINEAEKNFDKNNYNPRHNILTLFDISLRSKSPQVKRYLISNIRNLVQELPHELPNDLRLRVVRNEEILENYQILVETQPSVQSPFQKLNVDNSCQKTRKIRYYIFEVLSNFTVFFYFLPNILVMIAEASVTGILTRVSQ